jgi:hypothetical protein
LTNNNNKIITIRIKRRIRIRIRIRIIIIIRIRIIIGMWCVEYMRLMWWRGWRVVEREGRQTREQPVPAGAR